MTATTSQRADARILGALDVLRSRQPEEINPADEAIQSAARAHRLLRQIIARVVAVRASDGALQGWGPVTSLEAAGDAAPQDAAPIFEQVLQGLLANEDPASLDPRALRQAFDDWQSALNRFSAVRNSFNDPATYGLVRGWFDSEQQLFRFPR